MPPFQRADTFLLHSKTCIIYLLTCTCDNSPNEVCCISTGTMVLYKTGGNFHPLLFPQCEAEASRSGGRLQVLSWPLDRLRTDERSGVGKRGAMNSSLPGCLEGGPGNRSRFGACCFRTQARQRRLSFYIVQASFHGRLTRTISHSCRGEVNAPHRLMEASFRVQPQSGLQT